MQYLRQSTASQSLVIGPFVDEEDGVTPETGLTISNTDIRLSKNGANIVSKNSGGGTHDEIGYYTITLDATDTSTVGRLQLMVNESGALPVYHEFMVLEEAVYDAFFASSADGKPAAFNDLSQANVRSAIGLASANLDTQLSTIDSEVGVIDGVVDGIASAVGGLNDLSQAEAQSAAAAALTAYDPPTKTEMDAAIADATPAQIQGTAQGAGTGTDTVQLASGTISQDNDYVGRMLTFVRGTGFPYSQLILDSTASNQNVQLDGGALPFTPDTTSEYVIT